MPSDLSPIGGLTRLIVLAAIVTGVREFARRTMGLIPRRLLYLTGGLGLLAALTLSWHDDTTNPDW